MPWTRRSGTRYGSGITKGGNSTKVHGTGYAIPFLGKCVLCVELTTFLTAQHRLPPSSVQLTPVLNLLLRDLTQLIHMCRLARDRALRNLGGATKDVLVGDGIRGRNHPDADDADARVLRAAVVLTVTEVADPGLERRRIVLLDQLAVRDDLGRAADGGPLAKRVQESDVDVRVGGDVVRLAGLGVSVEEEVDAAGFLQVDGSETARSGHVSGQAWGRT